MWMVRCSEYTHVYGWCVVWVVVCTPWGQPRTDVVLVVGWMRVFGMGSPVF